MPISVLFSLKGFSRWLANVRETPPATADVARMAHQGAVAAVPTARAAIAAVLAESANPAPTAALNAKERTLRPVTLRCFLNIINVP